MKKKLLISVLVSTMLFSIISTSADYKIDIALTGTKTKTLHINSSLNNTADARGKIKTGREHKNKARKKGGFKPNKDPRAKAGTQKHTPSKKHKGGKKSKGSNKKKR
ncbi:hypothetical protein BU107_13925 [Staphylococcus xylosus]|uniref:hypothetical protein n=1 Tax=Staphylococcus xylosus TaxID=1288 RepID=UPI000E688EF6|nr:hypothetical protein [Staphylococcus xylosus]RIM82227.1 hypothetical protein BU107_13925 [Staphylococcus xylosus]